MTKTTTRRPKWAADTHAQLAEFFEVSPSTISYWRKTGAPISGRGPHDLAAVTQWLDGQRLRRGDSDPEVVNELIRVRSELGELRAAADSATGED